MELSISKTSVIPSDQALVVIGKPGSKWTSFGLTAVEGNYVDSLDPVKKPLLAINQYKRWVFIIRPKTEPNAALMAENMRKLGCKIFSYLHQLYSKSVTVVDCGGMEQATLDFSEGLALGSYGFLKYKNPEPDENKYLKNILINSVKTNADKIRMLEIMVHAVFKARDLVNEPVIFLTAVKLGEAFKKMGKEAGFSVEVFNKSRIENLKMGGLLAVNAGSVDPPTFTVMEYKPKNAKNKKPIILVGKGVVFDTGGLSLKPTPSSMDYMKSDMAGAAAVGCTLWALASAKVPLHVVALVPSTDNRPGGNAVTPGDIITMSNGMTIEVLNTDAEGRLILGDALHYAKKYNPELVLDFATLTGAASAAIGPFGMVVMGNASEKIKTELKASGEAVYERLAEFPFWDEYSDLLKSDIADMKNIGGPVAGAITAGKFLQKFTDYPWMHFDIAGVAFRHKEDSYRGIGASGVGVRLLFHFLRSQA